MPKTNKYHLVLERGNLPDYRIVLAGYEGEGHEILEKKGWKVFKWIGHGGYGRLGKGKGRENRYKECLCLSPHCFDVAKRNLTLWDFVGIEKLKF